MIYRYKETFYVLLDAVLSRVSQLRLQSMAVGKGITLGQFSRVSRLIVFVLSDAFPMHS